MSKKRKTTRAKFITNDWTREKTLHLIFLFQTNSDLWNLSSKMYFDRNHKRKLIAEIAEKIKVDADEVTAKLHNLRCQYNGECRKLKKKNNAGKAGEICSRWKYFDALKFLSNPRQSNPKTPNSVKQELNISEVENCSDSASSDHVCENSSPSASIPELLASPKDEPLAIASLCEQNLNLTPTLEGETLLNNAINFLWPPNDSQQVFGNFVADQLRNMSEPKQKRLKLLIQKVMIQVEEEN